MGKRSSAGKGDRREQEGWEGGGRPQGAAASCKPGYSPFGGSDQFWAYSRRGGGGRCMTCGQDNKWEGMVSIVVAVRPPTTLAITRLLRAKQRKGRGGGGGGWRGFLPGRGLECVCGWGGRIWTAIAAKTGGLFFFLSFRSFCVCPFGQSAGPERPGSVPGLTRPTRHDGA